MKKDVYVCVAVANGSLETIAVNFDRGVAERDFADRSAQSAAPERDLSNGASGLLRRAYVGGDVVELHRFWIDMPTEAQLARSA